jgi:predicted nucleic-acid-binding Zn-ribbon protein
MEKCPKCHSDHRVRAEVATEGNPLAGIRFHPEDLVTFSKRQKLQVHACPSCGYLEYFLVSDKESADPPGMGTWVFA